MSRKTSFILSIITALAFTALAVLIVVTTYS